MSIEPIDYYSESKDRVTSIFKESPLFLALIESIVTPYYNQQSDLLYFSENLLNIDEAEKSQLDFIGRIVGQPRLLSSFNTDPNFGFLYSYQSETFGTVTDENVGGIWNSYNSLRAASARRLNDEEYRRLIKARIIKNNSKCTTNELLQVLNLLTNTTNSTVYNSNGTLMISTTDTDGFVAYYVDKIGQEDEILPIRVGRSVALVE
jgi:hypothetical protein